MIFIVDKPAGLTSHDVVSRIKKAGGDRHLKIGHTGTLDPMCTGVLPILTGKDTKLSDLFVSDKKYLVGIRFGLESDTQDITGHIISSTKRKVTITEAERILAQFVGQQEQQPPMYSAVKVNGKKLYEYARKGIEVQRKSRLVTIFSLSHLIQTGDNSFLFEVHCSKGTYIRTLCADMGKILGVGAVMESLRRIYSNGFSEEQAIPFEQVLLLAAENRIQDISIHAEDAFLACKQVVIPDSGVQYYLNGGTIDYGRIMSEVSMQELLRAYDKGGKFLGLCRANLSGIKAVWFKRGDENG